ncbi:MAG: signal peptide peptidase SppA [Bacteroidales bacterium]|nr:signal peptide peptidase SppA [Bacteroidales bacterium]
MKEFFRTFFAVLAAVLVLWILGVIFSIIFFVSMASMGESTPKVEKNSILKIKLDEEIKEQKADLPFSFSMSGFKTEKMLSLRDVVNSIRHAATDDNIKGISLELDGIGASVSDVEEIRTALQDFRETGKFITAYGNNYTQKEYYLASVANEVYLNPIGIVDFKGLSGTLMFYKDLFDKLDIEMQIIRHGKYKSAVEPFIQNKMSEANREQTEKYISSVWNEMLQAISESRQISIDSLNRYADDIVIRVPNDAKKYHFIEGLMYEDEYIALLKSKMSVKNDKDLNYISLAKYIDASSVQDYSSDNPTIAVIYAEGEIAQGKSRDGVIGSESLTKEIRKARLDKDIKAIVFRVSSPGGDAQASDMILREVKLAAATKPTIVSMGEYAASGGYYISCGANYIFSDATTLTGSIGVFGMIPNAQKLLNEKLGIHTDMVKTNKNAENLTPFQPMTPFQYDLIQNSVENIYDIFITHVSQGRNMTKTAVDSIGGGRVWLGADALSIGLVDQFGGLNDAINYAALQIDAKDFKIEEFPKAKDLSERIIEELLGDVQMKIFDVPQQLSPFVQSIDKVLNAQGVQARLPYEIVIE